MRIILGWEALARTILREFSGINKKVDQIMATLADLEAKNIELQGVITDLKNDSDESRAAQATLIAKVQELKDAVAAGGSSAQITAILASMDDSITALKAIAAGEKDDTSKDNAASS